MECLSPLNIPRPNGWGASDRVTVPCGKCLSCLTKKRQDWHFRLSQELKNADCAVFVTLTYDEINQVHSVSKTDVQKWLKKLRKKYDLRYNPTFGDISQINALNRARIRYFLTAEYGTLNSRPHYHVILYNVSECDRDIIESSWQKGFIHIGNVTPESIGYVVKYCITSKDEIPGFNDEMEKPFSLMSKNPGIGVKYLEKTTDYHKKGNHFETVLPGGQKIPLPRYYRAKIFDDLETKINSLRAKKASEKIKDQKISEIQMRENPFNYQHEQKKQWVEIAKKRLSKNSKL